MHLLHGFEIGGLEQLVLDLAVHGRSRGIDPLILALGEDGPMRQAVNDRRLPLYWLEGLSGMGISTLRAIRQVLARADADIVHAHDLGPWLNAVAARALRPATRVVVTFHERRLPQGKTRLAASCAARFSSAIVACGNEVRACIEDWAPRRARVLTIGNGVRLPPVPSAEQRQEARARLGIPDGAVAIGYLGALKQVKGPDLLLEAFARRFRDHPDVHLVLVGGGSLEGELRSRAAGMSNVRFTGALMNAASLLCGLDIYAQTSRSEGRSLSMLEAMAVGLPTVAHALPGIEEIHARGETALLAPPEDVQAIGDALERLARDMALRERLGRAARARSEGFSFEATLAAYVELYRGLVTPRT